MTAKGICAVLTAGMIFASLSGAAAKQGKKTVPDKPAFENFEESRVPVGWNASPGGSVSVTKERFKSGEQSLLWTWSGNNASLTGAAPGGLIKMKEPGCLAFWVYNETPSDKILYMELLRDGKSVGACWYVLNFKGWRPFAAPYGQQYLYPERFMANPEHSALNGFRLTELPNPPGVNGMRLSVPPGSGAGKLYIDFVNFNCADKPYADYQQPWIDRPEILSTGNPLKYIYSSHDISQNRPWLPKFVPEEKITPEEKKSMETLLSRCVASSGPLREDGPFLFEPPPKPQEDPAVLDDFRKLEIKRSPNGILTGKPIIPVGNGNATWKFNNPPDGVVIAEGPTYSKVIKTPIMRRLISAYLFAKQKGNSEKAAEYKNAFFDLCDHLLDQGFAEGNTNISSQAFDYSLVCAMRDELAETGRLRDLLMAAASCSLAQRGEVLMLEDWTKSGYFPRNTDLIGNLGFQRLLVVTILLPDPAERLQRLYAYTRAINELANPELGEPYAWDGTVHHHPQFHVAYAFGILVKDAYNLRGTCFAVSPKTLALLKLSVTRIAFISDLRGAVPPNVPGYTGQPLGLLIGRIAYLLAKCGTPENKDGVDPDLAAIYNAMGPYDLRTGPLEPLKTDGPTPVLKQSGHVTLNGGPMAFHRRGNWLVSIAGQYKFRRAYESNNAYVASGYNHYSKNGSVFVISSGNPVSPWDSGFSLEGWDPRHQPGTTSYFGESNKDLLERVGKASSAFCSGTDMDGDGIWGMEFIHQSVAKPDNIKFHRSAFCFNNRITLITTDIGRDDAAKEAERSLKFATTLWQNSFGSGGKTNITGPRGLGRFGANTPEKPEEVPPAQEPCWIDGKEIKDFPWETTLPSGEARWLIDNKRTGYFIPPKSPPLHIARRSQSWTQLKNELWEKKDGKYTQGDGPNYNPKKDERNYNPTEGNFSVAWFEHGARPDVAECVYTLIPETTPEAMKNFATAMASPSTAPYVIREKDENAHILWDRETNTTGYIIFTPKWAAPKNSRLVKVNRICSVMIKENNDGTMKLSAASSDMDEWPAWGGGKIKLSGNIVLTLDGKWLIADIAKDAPADCSAAHANGKTTLAIPYKTFLPVNLTLKPAN